MIRQATIEDLPGMEAAAREFLGESRFFGPFEMGRFVALWSQLIGSGMGVIFILENDGALVGCIGGVATPEPYSADLAASEFFWSVMESHRGGGLHLYRAFEAWARAKGCQQIRLCHMLDSMPEKLSHVYRRLGFEPAEVHYVKSL